MTVEPAGRTGPGKLEELIDELRLLRSEEAALGRLLTAGARSRSASEAVLEEHRVSFDDGHTQIHQVLAVAPDRGRSGFPLRPDFSSGV